MKNNCRIYIIILLLINITLFSQNYEDCECDYVIDQNSNYQQYPEDLDGIGPGKVICFVGNRTIPIRFRRIEGSRENPIILKNCGGQVLIPSLELDSCKYIKVTGTGDPDTKYGFRFSGDNPWVFGVNLNGLSSDIELEYLHIGGPNACFGVVAKKDYSGNPPTPLPLFENLIIHDLFIDQVPIGCGMYIGETKTPAMEFKHVRIYNNVVINTGRESIQVGHCNEDIEVYNNFCMNAGILDIPFQGNNLQLGYRTEGYYYNNIFLNAPAFGVICLSNRGFSIFNNYSQNNTGIFIDDREDEHEPAPIKVNNNYFYNNSGVQYFEIFNEKTKLMFFDNFVNDDVPLYSKLGNVKEDSLVFENNTLGAITQLDYTSAYRVQGHYFNNGMGPIRGLTHKFNYDGIREFEIMAIDSIYIQKNIPDTIFISCVDRTEKPISYTVTNLPPFAKFVDNQNETAMVTFLIDNNQELQKKYTFNINVQEENGDTADVNIDVFTNLPPKANAGDNFEIKLPVDSLILQGDASSGDGVLTYLWITTSSAIIENETTLSPTIFNINSIGEYIFSLIVTDEDGDVDTSNIIVTVMPEPILVDSVSVSQLSADIEENATIQLSANVIPSNADNKNVLWSSSNENIATVNEDGLVTGLAEGVVNIIATSSDGNASASIEITVSKSSNKSIISDISNSEIICTILPNSISIINQSNFNQISIKIINELGQSYFSANSKKKELLIDFNEIRMSKGIYRLIIMYDNQIIKVKKFIYQ